MLSAPFSPPALHIPDGFLSIAVSIVLWIATIIVVAISLQRVKQDLGEKQVPLMGILAAAIFAGQMLNFPVAGGTSGHLLGAALATIVLGPYAAVLVMASVLGVQAIVLQDGGLLALGANIFNMGIVGVVVTHFIYRTLRNIAGSAPWGIFVGGFAAAMLSVIIAALATALQLALSGTSPANIAIPAMGSVHLLIGVGEGLITLGALAFLYYTRPDLLKIGQAKPAGRAVWLAGLAIALAIAVASPLASAYPDGLEYVAAQQGFQSAAQPAPYQLMPDYIFPGIENKALATIAAAIVGTLIVAVVAFTVAYTRRTRTETNTQVPSR